MIVTVVKCAVGDNNIRGHHMVIFMMLILARFVGGHHQEWQLICRLPNPFSIVLYYLFGVQIGLLSVVVPRFGAPYIIYFVVIMFGLHIVSRLLVFIQSLRNYAPSQYVEPCLGFCQSFSFGCFL